LDYRFSQDVWYGCACDVGLMRLWGHMGFKHETMGLYEVKWVVDNKNRVWGVICNVIIINISSYKYEYGKKSE
jgi:hypothetical protein